MRTAASWAVATTSVCRSRTRARGHDAFAFAFALTRPRLPVYGPASPFHDGYGHGQTRPITSSYASRDHSISLANCRCRPARDPPVDVWLDDFQCCQYSLEHGPDLLCLLRITKPSPHPLQSKTT